MMALTKALLNGKLMFPAEFVSAVELLGKDVTVTIKSVQLEGLKLQGGRSERKPVLSFVESKKRLVLNKTNAGTIADLYGPKAEEWAGKKITLYPTRTQFGRETCDCIRIREKVKPHAAPPPIDDEPPVDDVADDVFAGGGAAGADLPPELSAPIPFPTVGELVGDRSDGT